MSSKAWDKNVANAYNDGDVLESRPSLVRINSGVDAVIKVGNVEWRIVRCATDVDVLHDPRDDIVDIIDRGG